MSRLDTLQLHQQTYISQSWESVIISQLFCRSVSSSSVIRETLRCRRGMIDTRSSCLLVFHGAFKSPLCTSRCRVLCPSLCDRARHIFHLCAYTSPAPNNRSIPLCFSTRSEYVRIWPAPASCILRNAGQAWSIVRTFRKLLKKWIHDKSLWSVRFFHKKKRLGLNFNHWFLAASSFRNEYKMNLLSQHLLDMMLTKRTSYSVWGWVKLCMDGQRRT